MANSIFPGVDPFVESQGFWPDFHARMLTLLCDAIFDELPEQYEARIEERFTILDVESETGKPVGPDIGVLRRKGTSKKNTRGASAATLEPVRIPLLIQEEIRETYIKILWRPLRTIVSIVEVLSPSNKEKPGYDYYLHKRHEVLKQPIHWWRLTSFSAAAACRFKSRIPWATISLWYHETTRGRNAKSTIGRSFKNCPRFRFHSEKRMPM
jgi:hypothetical protein